MISDPDDQSDCTPIVIDDVIVHDSTIASDSTIKDKSIQYDDTKIAPTCLAQFFISYNTETKSAVCLLCKSTVKKSGDSTFNFVRHVKRNHGDAYNTWTMALATKEEKIQSKQPSIKDAMNSPRGTKYTSGHPRQIQLSKMVTNDLIIGLVLPLSIVERPEFLRAMHTVDPKFVVPSRRSICLTIDTWTDRRMRCFYGITIHLIEQCLFKSYLLAFKYLSGSHTGDKLLKEYEAIMAQYDIEQKVVRLVTDNASNNIKAFGSLIVPGFEPYFEESSDERSDEEDEEEEERIGDDRETNSNEINDWCDTLFVSEELLRLPCYIHTLQLVVSDGLKESFCIKAAISKVSSIAKFSHKSIVMAEKLEQDGFSIPVAVITRWNSQYCTVAKTIEIPSDKLNDYLRQLKKDSLILSQRDITVLNEFISVFALFAEAFTKAQADEAASISLVAPSLLEIYFDLESEQATLKYASGLCKALLKSIQERFGGLLKQLGLPLDITSKTRSTSELYSDSLFIMAPFLDARFGDRWIIHSKLQDETKSCLCETIKRLIANAALQLQGSDSKEKAETVVEAPLVVASNNTSVTLKRKTLFAFPKTQEPLTKKTRSSVLEQIEEEILLFSSDDSALIFKKAKTYPYHIKYKSFI
ncbi:unnamed protein product [Didymodactylos carnosus]|uniref:Uncharacterized protein n=1 Tax=Didymodactylos carnosus TaxID=1234261 RepID=A0A814VPZ2_9BILA|nr:unnamed protein product [Didymodactylos carnosus]CAF3958339.1 unnamed protein product [Didymodactylos carnosus]